MTAISLWSHLRKGFLIHSFFLSLLLPSLVLLVVVLAQQGIYQVLSYSKFLDIGYQARGSRRADQSILLVNLEKLPVSRSQLAIAMDIVKQCAPRAIGLDVVLDRIGDSKEDSLLANAVRTTVPIVIASELEGNTVVLPHQVFRKENVSSGFSQLMTGRDGVVRRFHTKRKLNGNFYPSFATQVAIMAGCPVDSNFPPGNNFLINYSGDEQVFNTVGLTEVIRRYEENGNSISDGTRAVLNGKIVVFGYFFADSTHYPVFTDVHNTPLLSGLTRLPEGKMYGSIIHANILDTLVSNRKILEISRHWSFGLSVFLVLINLIAEKVLTEKSGRRRRGLFFAALLVEFAALASLPFLLFFYQDIQINLTVPLIALILLPRAGAVYSHYADKLAGGFHRLTKRGFPSFLVEPCFRIHNTTSLADRLSTALHSARIISEFTGFLLQDLSRSGKAKNLWPELEAVFSRLRNSVGNLNQILSRAYVFLAIDERFHEVKTEFMLHYPEIGTAKVRPVKHSAASGDFGGRHIVYTLLGVPSRNQEVYFEGLCLETISCISRVLRDLRPLFRKIRLEEVRAVPFPTGNIDQPIAQERVEDSEIHIVLTTPNGEQIDVFPFVLKRWCAIHPEEEYFVRTHESEEDRLLKLPLSYRGPSPSCFFRENIPASQAFQQRPM